MTSPVLLKALKEYVAAKEAEATGFGRIQVEFEDSDDNHLPKKKAFHGRWIFSPSQPLQIWDESGTESDVYCVAVAAKGSVVVYMWETRESGGELYIQKKRFLVFPSFEEAARNNEVNYAIRRAVQARGVPVEELDI